MTELTTGNPRLRPVTPTGIIAARLRHAVGLAELLDSVTGEHGVARDLLQELHEISALASGLEGYVEQCTTPPSGQLTELADRTRVHAWTSVSSAASASYLEAEMLSGHVEGQLLKFLVTMSGARTVLDVGMFTGYSALAMAEALGEGGRVVACEIDSRVATFAQRAFDASPDGAKIEVRLGPAESTLTMLAAAGQCFDLIFIDADKPGYLTYLAAVLDTELLADGGTIVVDNTLMQGQPWTDPQRSINGSAIATFNAAVVEDNRLEQVLLPLRDGVTLIRRRR